MATCSKNPTTTDSPPHQVHPCLVFNPGPHQAQCPSKPTSYFNLFSLLDRKLHSFTPPTPSVCIGSGHGFLFLSDRLSDLSLFNPITKQHLHLPKLTTLSNVAPILNPSTLRLRNYSLTYQPFSEPLEIPPEHLTPRLIPRALVLSNPTGGDLTALLILSLPTMALAYAKPGDDRWTVVDHPIEFLDVICHKDQIFTVMRTGAVYGWGVGSFLPMRPTMADVKFVAKIEEEVRELDDLNKVLQFEFRNMSMFLVFSPSGDLLRVRKERVTGASRWGMRVHKVVFDEPEPQLVEVKNLGENTILLGGNTAMCVSSINVPELKGNCIYFAEGSMAQLWCDIGIYSMQDGSVELMFPSMLPPYPRPSWIMTTHA